MRSGGSSLRKRKKKSRYLAILFNGSGLGLIEVLIAGALLAVLAMTAQTVFNTGLKGQKALVARDDARVLIGEMVNILINDVACKNTFGGMDPVSGATVSQIKDASNSPRFEAGKKYGNNTISLKSITVGGSGTDPRTNLQKWTPTAPNRGSALVLVTWEQVGGIANRTGPQDLIRFLFIDATLDAGNKIISCTSQSGTASNSGSGNQGFYAIWDTATTLKDSITRQTGSNSATHNGNFYIENPYQLGVGTNTPHAKLEVNGAIKIGSMATCGLNEEGSLRYNSSLRAMEFCNGTVWAAVGSGVPTGAVMSFALGACPAGWTEYLPARGRFIRGMNGWGVDPDGNRPPGGIQNDAVQNHQHFLYGQSGGLDGIVALQDTNPDNTFDTKGAGSRGDSYIFVGDMKTGNISTETRPKNVSLLFCRKN